MVWPASSSTWNHQDAATMPATANPIAGRPASSRATISLTTMNRARHRNAAK